LTKKHGPALRQSGLITDEPVRLWRGTDLRGHGANTPYFVETFQWKDGGSADIAHQTPEVMSVWETMGPHMEGMTITILEPIAS
jgi:hypothetical protein